MRFQSCNTTISRLVYVTASLQALWHHLPSLRLSMAATAMLCTQASAETVSRLPDCPHITLLARRWRFASNPTTVLSRAAAAQDAVTVPDASVRSLGRALLGQGYQVFLRQDHLYAFKGLAGKYGPLGVHASMLAIMAGGPLLPADGVYEQQHHPCVASTGQIVFCKHSSDRSSCLHDLSLHNECLNACHATCASERSAQLQEQALTAGSWCRSSVGRAGRQQGHGDRAPGRPGAVCGGHAGHLSAGAHPRWRTGCCARR